jgi:aldehyde dehydrogenase (NAD+)
VVLIMAPWNYPVQLLLSPLIAAVAAGNCVILRPSEKVPRTAAVLASIIRTAFDQAEVACVTEPGLELARALVQLPFDHIFFTGSSQVGRQVLAAAASTLTTVTLELGGKSPVVVDATADVARAAERSVWGKFLNAGQTCVAPDYALVDERVLPAFVDAAGRSIARFYGPTDSARQASPDYPRIIDQQAFARLCGLLEAAIAAGARVALGGQTDAVQRYIAPTLLTNLSWDSPIMREEIFGPILPIVSFGHLSDELARLTARGTPLAIYLFSRRPERIESVLRGSASGGVVINDVVVHLANPYLPFGGLGDSGQGSYHGWYGFRTFSHERSVMYQGRLGVVKLLHPPYRHWMQRVLNWLLLHLG